MHITVSNQKRSAEAVIQAIENLVIIFECKESYRFKENDPVQITIQSHQEISVQGKTLSSNDGHLYVVVTEEQLKQLELADRRKFPRYTLPKPIFCTILEHHSNGITKRYNGYLHDVSYEGLKITSEFPLRIKQSYEILIADEEKSLPNFDATVVVKNARMDFEYDEKIFGTVIESVQVESQILLDHLITKLQQQSYSKPSFLHKIRAFIS
jgi:PilZ domain